MNYLSHYYFDKHIEEPYYVLGLVIPDLQRGFSKIYNTKLKKFNPIRYDNRIFEEIHNGIIRHYHVDKIFHNSRFFGENSEIIKRKIQDRIPNLRRKYFAAHVLLEMLLDRQILFEEEEFADKFYLTLSEAESESILLFYDHHDLGNSEMFLDRLHSFLSFKYLYRYQDTESFVRAFSRVYLGGTGQRIDVGTHETLKMLVSDMDEILKHKWRNPFNHI